jgi:hypothetical protein
MRIRAFGQFLNLPFAVLTAVEAGLFFAAFIAASAVRVPLVPGTFAAGAVRLLVAHVWPRALLFSLVVVVCLLALGLYSARQRARVGGVAVRICVAFLAAIIVIALFLYLMPGLWIGRDVLIFATLGAAVAVVVSRLVFSRVVDESLFKRRVLVYGCGRNAAPIAKLRRRSDRRGFTLVGFVQPEGEICMVAPETVLVPSGRLSELCAEHDVDEVVVAMEDRRRAFPILELLECRLAGIDIIELLTFLERETGRVRIDVLNPSWMIFGEGFRRDRCAPVLARRGPGRKLGDPADHVAGNAAHAAGHQARGRLARASLLRAAARRPWRPRVQRAQVPQHVPGRRAGWPGAVGNQGRLARHPRGRVHPQMPYR